MLETIIVKRNPRELKKLPTCPFETKAIKCIQCDGHVNVAFAGPGLTEVHCDDCGTHYGLPISRKP